MAANTTGPIWELVPFNKGVEFTSSDTTAKKTIITAGANGSRIDQLRCATNDTAAVNLQVYVQVGGAGTDFYIGVVAIPIGSGYTTVLLVDGITILDPILGYLYLGPNDVLKGACLATMTAAKTTDIMAMGGDY